jgi:hypothetical protein
MLRVIALAGRRVDAVDAKSPRFPLARVPLVRQQLRDLFAKTRASMLVCSAACGADLTALEAAEMLGLRRRIVLPFSVERFRETSVTDRPGDWGALYDRTVEAVRQTGDLIVLENVPGEDRVYEIANRRILDEAVALSGSDLSSNPQRSDWPTAVIVWEGRTRGSGDVTQQFADGAKQGRLRVQEVLTLNQSSMEGGEHERDQK